MYSLEKFMSYEMKLNYSFDKNLFLNFCKEYSILAIEHAGAVFDSSHDTYGRLLDHLYKVKNVDGEEFYISNTYLSINEILETLKQYKLSDCSIIRGISFWNKNSALVVLKTDNLDINY